MFTKTLCSLKTNFGLIRERKKLEKVKRLDKTKGTK